MKKINYLIIILSISIGSIFAQQNVGDFENLTLASESYWDGSDMSGFHNNSVFFNIVHFILPAVVALNL